jgi:hypothetical protein
VTSPSDVQPPISSSVASVQLLAGRQYVLATLSGMVVWSNITVLSLAGVAESAKAYCNIEVDGLLAVTCIIAVFVPEVLVIISAPPISQFHNVRTNVPVL